MRIVLLHDMAEAKGALLNGRDENGAFRRSHGATAETVASCDRLTPNDYADAPEPSAKLADSHRPGGSLSRGRYQNSRNNAARARQERGTSRLLKYQ